MSDKRLREKIVKDLQDFMKKSQITIGGDNYYSSSEVVEFQNQLLISLGLEEVQSGLKLSTRKAAIIIIEEQITIYKENRSELYLEKIIDRVIHKYGKMVRQRDKTKLISIEHVHPNKPCVQFQDNKRSMGEYYKALTYILASKDLIITYSDVTVELEKAKDKVIDCG